MGAQSCSCRTPDHSASISCGESKLFSINLDEENVMGAEEEKKFDVIKVLNIIQRPDTNQFREKNLNKVPDSVETYPDLLPFFMDSTLKAKKRAHTEWITELQKSFIENVKDLAHQNSDFHKGGRQKIFENHMGSFFPKYKQISIHESVFFKIRKEPIKKYYSMGLKIGQGTFGSVFEGNCLKTGEKRAIKILKRKIMKENDLEMFKNEVNILKKMDHVNIIKIYDIFSFANFFYVVTEYCAGGSLVNAFQKQKLKNKKIIQIIMKQTLSALLYMHAKFFVHLDIKLENLVLVNQLQDKDQEANNICVKIIDFGLAKQSTQFYGNKCPLVGTPSYMSPEILKNRTFCFQSDIWSTGILFCLLLTGSNPFKERKQAETFSNIVTKVVDFKNDLPYKNLSDSARDLLSKMLEKNPMKRITSAQAINHPYIAQIHIKSNKFLQQQIEVVNNITNYSRGSNFTCFVKKFLTSKIVTQSKRQEIALIFQKIDTDASGTIDKQELMQLYHIVTGITSEEVENYIKKLDDNKSQKIDFNQFLLAMTNADDFYNLKYLQQAFYFFDEDKTDFIEKNELMECLVGCQEQQIINIIQSIDFNGDGKISKDQFCEYMLELKF